MEPFFSPQPGERHVLGTYNELVTLQRAAEEGGLVTKVNEHLDESFARAGKPRHVSIDFGRPDTTGIAFLDAARSSDDQYVLTELDLSYSGRVPTGPEVSGNEQFMQSGGEDVIQSTCMVSCKGVNERSLATVRVTGNVAVPDDGPKQEVRKVVLQFPGDPIVEFDLTDEERFPLLELTAPTESFDLLPYMGKLILENSGKEVVYACIQSKRNVYIMLFFEGVRLSVDFSLPTDQDVEKTAEETVKILRAGELPVRFAPRVVSFTKSGLN